MNKALFLVLIILPVLCVSGQESHGVKTEPQAGILPTAYDVIAEVRITNIQHSLRASDARRVEYGAPPPLIPYKALLEVRRTYPKIRLYRLVLEGLAATGWMPEQNMGGILLLTRSGDNYIPAAPFPLEGFLPEQEINGEAGIEYPSGSGVRIPVAHVWECLSDLLDARTTPPAAALVEKWRRVFLEGEPQAALASLLFLLCAPGDTLSCEMLSARLAPGSGDGPASLPFVPAVQILAASVSPEKAASILELVLDTAPEAVMPDTIPVLAAACISFVSRVPEDQRAASLEKLLACEWERNGFKEALINTIAPVESLLLATGDQAHMLLLGRMLKAPSHFPFLRRHDALEVFWKLLDRQSHPELKPYLQRFLEKPTSEFLGIPLATQDLQSLVSLAKRMTDITSTAGTS